MGKRNGRHRPYRTAWGHGIDRGHWADGCSINDHRTLGLHGTEWGDGRDGGFRAYWRKRPHGCHRAHWGDRLYGDYWEHWANGQHWKHRQYRQHRRFRCNWQYWSLGGDRLNRRNWGSRTDGLCSKWPEWRNWAFWANWASWANRATWRGSQHGFHRAIWRDGAFWRDWSYRKNWADGRCIDGRGTHGVYWTNWHHGPYWQHGANRARRYDGCFRS